MVVKDNPMIEKNFKSYGKNNKELNALIEKKIQKFVKNKKRRKTEKELQHFQEKKYRTMKAKTVSQALPSVRITS